jgi:hypothetical protein
MKKLSAVIGLALFVGAGVVLAANVHFKRDPTVTDNGTTLTLCASLAGLGNEDLTITVNVTGLADTTCISPGGNEAPGQNKIPFAASVSRTVRSTQIKNGNVSFCVTTPQPGRISGREAGCPNNNWRGRINDVEFESATIVVEQGGEVVLEQEL